MSMRVYILVSGLLTYGGFPGRSRPVSGRAHLGWASTPGGRLFGWPGSRRLAQGNDVDVDAKRTRLSDNPGHVRAAAGQLLPPTALAGPDDDLGDLMLLREGGDGPGGIVTLYLVPAGTDIGCQFSQLLDQPAIRRAGGVAAGHVEDVEFSPEPGGHPGRAPWPAVRPGNPGDGHHDALAGLPHDLGVVPPQVLPQVLVGLVSQEPQRELPQGGQVVDAEGADGASETLSFG